MDCGRPTSRNPDRWLQNCPDFSRPICLQLREWIFQWEPDLTESVKWNTLCFTGRKMVCALSGCKKHVGVTFFRGRELHDPTGILSGPAENANMLSLRLTDLAQLPRPAFRRVLRSAVLLDADPERPPLAAMKRQPLPAPDFLTAALRKNPSASRGFTALAPSYQREYIVWLNSAKREETRRQRLDQTLRALASGLKWLDRKNAL